MEADICALKDTGHEKGRNKIRKESKSLGMASGVRVQTRTLTDTRRDRHDVTGNLLIPHYWPWQMIALLCKKKETKGVGHRQEALETGKIGVEQSSYSSQPAAQDQ